MKTIIYSIISISLLLISCSKKCTIINGSISNLQIDTLSTRVKEVNNQVIFETTIFNCNSGKDDAHCAVAVIMLPNNENILSFSAEKFNLNTTTLNVENLNYSQNGATITCKIGHLSRSDNSTMNNAVRIKIVTKKPNNDQYQLSIVTYNSTPENNLRNNYWIWRNKNREGFDCSINIKN